jgi:glycosyltransferase involved in cell wall biosynthesis
MNVNKTAIIIPCHNVKKNILNVIRKIDFKLIDTVYLVDDKCPQKSVIYAKKILNNKKIKYIFLKKNLGVGGATIEGFKKALISNHTILIKIDGDGQHDPKDIVKFIQMLNKKNVKYCKGTRLLKKNNIKNMPKLRFFGNIVLTYVNRYMTRNHNLTDCLNGFLGIKASHLRKINLNEIKKNFFFEQDLLFKLSLINTDIKEIPIKIKYFNTSVQNLSIPKIVFPFILYHYKNLMIKIFSD